MHRNEGAFRAGVAHQRGPPNGGACSAASRGGAAHKEGFSSGYERRAGGVPALHLGGRASEAGGQARSSRQGGPLLLPPSPHHVQQASRRALAAKLTAAVALTSLGGWAGGMLRSV